jgi:hypothetical protein
VSFGIDADSELIGVVAGWASAGRSIAVTGRNVEPGMGEHGVIHGESIKNR